MHMEFIYFIHLFFPSDRDSSIDLVCDYGSTAISLIIRGRRKSIYKERDAQLRCLALRNM